MLFQSYGYLLFSLSVLSLLSIIGIYFLTLRISNTLLRSSLRLLGVVVILILAFAPIVIGYFG